MKTLRTAQDVPNTEISSLYFAIATLLNDMRVCIWGGLLHMSERPIHNPGRDIKG
jgi:hypothetical protein